MIKNISAWKISSLNEYSVQIRLGSNLGGFFLFQEEGGCLWQKKVDQMDPDEKIVETAIERLELRVTEDELMKIRDRMEEAGISSLTAYLVRMATHGYVIVMDLSDLKEILRLLQISGNNLNQYAKKANETGSIYHEDIEEMKNNQKEILQEMRKVLDRLTAIM